MVEHRTWLDDGRLDEHRRRRTRAELDKVLAATLRSQVRDLVQGPEYEAQVDKLVAGETDPYRAAETLLSLP